MKVVIDLRPPHIKWQASESFSLVDISNTSGQIKFPVSQSKQGEKTPDFSSYPESRSHKARFNTIYMLTIDLEKWKSETR